MIVINGDDFTLIVGSSIGIELNSNRPEISINQTEINIEVTGAKGETGEAGTPAPTPNFLIYEGIMSYSGGAFMDCLPMAGNTLTGFVVGISISNGMFTITGDNKFPTNKTAVVFGAGNGNGTQYAPIFTAAFESTSLIRIRCYDAISNSFNSNMINNVYIQIKVWL